MTPLAGLLMGTRSGDVDPGALLYLLEQGVQARTNSVHSSTNKAGLLGLSGVSNDMRDIHAAVRESNREAEEALEVFCYRIRKTVGAYAAAMRGLGRGDFYGRYRRERRGGEAALGRGLGVFGARA